MKISDACEAIKAGHRIRFRYNGAIRVVEIHAVGYSKDNKPMMLAWQVSGDSRSKNPTPWRMFNLNEIVELLILDEKSDAPRPQYAGGNRSIHQIVCEI